ncbi:MAG: C1 family peptidase [Lewinellaceae bacterium]|nr:C1 family peptidase [Lewinellaceae bacterium]
MKKNRLVLFLLLFLFTTNAFAQAHRLGGVRFEDEKYKTIPLKSALRSSEPGKAKSLRNLLKVSPMDQGHVSACASYSVAQALAIQRKLYLDENCPPPKPLEAFSASYSFNQLCINNDCDQGVYMSDVLEILVLQGICPASVFPNDRYGCDSLPLPSHREAARNYRISRYKRIFKLEEECLGEADYLRFFKEHLVQNAIALIDLNYPIIVVLEVTPDFGGCPDGKYWRLPKGVSPDIGHAMALIGYDDIRHEFELLNSFGPGWCDHGFVRISYDDFVRSVRYGFVVFLDGAARNCEGR